MGTETTKKKSVILLSSGLDSTVNFLVALRKTHIVLALTFDYGQRAAAKEIENSQKLCERYGVPHKVIELPWLKEITKTSLVNRSAAVPTEVSIDDVRETQSSARAVWVPNRNGAFLNFAASFAESLGAEIVIPGFNKEEAATFPDNSEDYLDAATTALGYSTSNHVEVECYTSEMVKTEIAQLGRELGMDFNGVWTCYLGEAEPCNECESCLRFARAKSSLVAATRISEVNEASSYFS
jgi:7-cyano-7-deazaguanine synthase